MNDKIGKEKKETTIGPIKTDYYPHGALFLRQSLASGELEDKTEYDIGANIGSGGIIVNFHSNDKNKIGDTWSISLKEIMNAVLNEREKIKKKEAIK